MLLKKLVALAFFLTAAFQVNAFNIRPVDGLWSFDSELNLAVGRAVNLELSNGLLVVTMYTYNAQRAPTFYVGSGFLAANNVATGVFSEPQGGTCLGCVPSSGRLLSTPGSFTFEFTSSTTGYLTLPGEARKTITKGAITRASAPSGLLGTWVFNYIGSNNIPKVVVADLVNLSVVSYSTTFGNGVVMSADGRFACEYQISGRYAGAVLCFTADTPSVYNKSMLGVWWDNDMDGYWQFNNLGINDTFTGKRITNGGSSLGIKRDAKPDMEMLERRRLGKRGFNRFARV